MNIAEDLELLTAAEVAAILKVSPKTILNRATQPERQHMAPPSLTVGGRRYWRRSSVSRWLEEQERATAPRRGRGRPRKREK